MIYDFDEKHTVSLNVKLKSGEYFENKDITSRPFGDLGTVVSFWHDGKVRIYPLESVEYCEFVVGNG